MGNKAKKKEILIKVICILLSFGLWLYVNNIENPKREIVVANIPVEIVGSQILSQYGLALAPNQDITVSLKVEGPSSQIYKINKSQFKLFADLGAYGLTAGENNIPVEIASAPNGIVIQNNYPLVKIKLEALEKKTMPIYSEINVKNSAGTYVKKVNISPATAVVEGPESLVNEVTKLVIREQVDNVNSAEVLNLPIIALNSANQVVNGVTINPATANALINVEKGTTVPIKVETTGELPNGISLKSIIPSVPSIEIVTNQKGAAPITSISTEPINLSNITGSTDIPVKLKLPAGVINLSGSNTINVRINVNKAMSKTISVPIEMTGENENYKYALSQTSAEVILTGSEKDLEAVDPSKITCQVNVSDLTSSGDVNLVINNPYTNVKINQTLPAAVGVTVTPIVKPVEPTPPEDKPDGTDNETKPEIKNPVKPTASAKKATSSDDKKTT